MAVVVADIGLMDVLVVDFINRIEVTAQVCSMDVFTTWWHDLLQDRRGHDAECATQARCHNGDDDFMCGHVLSPRLYC